MAQLFTDRDQWAGGLYELDLCYRTSFLAPALAGLRALWSHEAVAPGYPRIDVEPDQQNPLDLGTAGLDELQHIYGMCQLKGVTVASCSTLIAYEEEEQVWIYFGFPMASLGRAFPVGGYPFGDVSGAGPAWRDEVDEWLFVLAEDVHAQAPFDCGLIGHEPIDEWSIADEVSQGRIPVIRRELTILVPNPSRLSRYPPTDESTIRKIQAGEAVRLARQILSSVEPAFQTFSALFEEIVSIEGSNSPSLAIFRHVLSASRHIRQGTEAAGAGNPNCTGGERHEESEIWRSCSDDIRAACHAVIERYEAPSEA